MKRRDVDTLQHIVRYCEDIGRTMQRFGRDKSILEGDRDYLNSVCMSLLQIGELVGHLTEGYRNETINRMHWPSIKGMRNIIAHDYGATDIDRVWISMTEDIPELLAFCDEELKKANKLTGE